MDNAKMPSPMITLESTDGQKFQVEVKVAQCSTVFKEMMEALGTTEDVVISVPPNAPNISGDILRMIIKWADFHKNDPAPAEDDDNEVKSRDDISSLEAEFLPVDQSTLFQLIRAANFLNIKGLLEVTCKLVAEMIEKKNAVEVREMFNIPNDFTPEEESQISRENEWFGDMNKRLVDGSHADDNDRQGSGSDAESGGSDDMGDGGSEINVDDNPPDHIQNTDNEPGHLVVADCVSNTIILRTILGHFSNVELIELSFVNKLWNQEARNVMRKRGNVLAFVCYDSSHLSAFNKLEEDLHQMNVVPFSGISIDIRRLGWRSSLNSLYEVICNRLPLKHLSVSLLDWSTGVIVWPSHTDHPVLVLLKNLMQHYSGALEHLALNIPWEREVFIQNFVQDCTFPSLRVLKLEDGNCKSSTLLRGYAEYIRALVSRAPNLQELHTVGGFDLRENVLEGTDAFLLYGCDLLYPIQEISENLANRLRLESLKMEYLPFRVTIESFSSMTQRVLQASSTTLRSMDLDTRLAVPLMCHSICFPNVKKLNMPFDYYEMQANPRIRKILNKFDFKRIFPSLTKVSVLCAFVGFNHMLPDYLNAITVQVRLLQAAAKSQPSLDRATNIKELSLCYQDYSHNVPSPFVCKMFPNIEKLELNLWRGCGCEVAFGSIWKHFKDLKELEVKGSVIQYTGNLDSVFCGIFPEEVAELRLQSEEYLEAVHIVPVMPAITCLKKLTTVKLTNKIKMGSYVDDGTFMFSKVTELIVCKRRPSLALHLNFPVAGRRDLPVSHLSFAAVTYRAGEFE